MEHSDEILIEYKKNLSSADAIAIVMDRYKQLEQIQKQKAEKEKNINDEEMLEKIDSVLSAPKVECKPEEVVTATFKATCLKSQMIKLVNFMKEEGIAYEQCK